MDRCGVPSEKKLSVSSMLSPLPRIPRNVFAVRVSRIAARNRSDTLHVASLRCRHARISSLVPRNFLFTNSMFEEYATVWRPLTISWWHGFVPERQLRQLGFPPRWGGWIYRVDRDRSQVHPWRGIMCHREEREQCCPVVDRLDAISIHLIDSRRSYRTGKRRFFCYAFARVNLYPHAGLFD